MIQSIEAWVALTWATLQVHAIASWDKIQEWRLLTPMQSTVVIFIVTMCFMLPIMHMWLRRPGITYRKIVLMSLCPPLALLILLQTPTGFAGVPDDNCQKYNRGKMMFTLIGNVVIPQETEDVYGTTWLILLVRAPDRWGHESHQCRLPISDAKAKAIMDMVKEAERLSVGSGRQSLGELTFSFGGQDEKPNVKIKSRKADPKMDPPEVLEKEKRDT